MRAVGRASVDGADAADARDAVQLLFDSVQTDRHIVFERRISALHASFAIWDGFVEVK